MEPSQNAAHSGFRTAARPDVAHDRPAAALPRTGEDAPGQKRGYASFGGDDPRAPARPADAPIVLTGDAATLIAPRALATLIQEICADRATLRAGVLREQPDDHEGWNVALIVRTASSALRAAEDARGADYRRNLVRVASLAMRAIEQHDQAEAQG